MIVVSVITVSVIESRISSTISIQQIQMDSKINEGRLISGMNTNYSL